MEARPLLRELMFIHFQRLMAAIVLLLQTLLFIQLMPIRSCKPFVPAMFTFVPAVYRLTQLGFMLIPYLLLMVAIVLSQPTSRWFRRALRLRTIHRYVLARRSS